MFDGNHIGNLLSVLGIAFHVARSVWYPVVGIRHSLLVRVNFGQDKAKPFRYTLADSNTVDLEPGN